jgi:dUTP pyrophosphatase
MTQIRIKRFDTSLPLPEYKTKGAAAFDFVARETVSVKPGKVGDVPVNVAIETPPEHVLLIAARTSTHKLGLMLANGVGIGDPDHCGDEDEYGVLVYNFTKKTVVVERGMRIAQGLFVKIPRATWKEVRILGNKKRGRVGSTGLK